MVWIRGWELKLVIKDWGFTTSRYFPLLVINIFLVGTAMENKHRFYIFDVNTTSGDQA